MIEVYKLHDRATGLWNAGGTRWTKRGKVWSAAPYLKSALTEHAKTFAHRVEPDWSKWFALRDDTAKMYSLLPETWRVVIISAEGQQYIPARDFWSYKKA